MISVEQLEEASGLHTGNWAGNCYHMACEAAKLIEGARPVYGHFRGAVHPKSMFSRPAVTGWVQHGWVVLPDGKVLDPTRWVFECKKPYIFMGTAGVEYDEGGNTFRMSRLGPPPEFDFDEKVFHITPSILSTDTWCFVEDTFRLRDMLMDDEYNPGDITLPQLHWLANQDPKVLGRHAGPIYGMLERLNLRGFIPIDNYRMVKEGRA